MNFEKFSNLLMVVGGSATIGLGVIQTFFFTVQPGERVVIFDKFSGISQKVKGEGLHFYIPLVQYPQTFEVRLQPKVIATQSGTKDIQIVDIALRILYRPMEEYLPKIYSDLGSNYAEKLLPSIGNEVLKSLVAQYDAEQLLKQREKISFEIKEALTSRARDFHVYLDDVAITHLAYGKDFAAAIEFKQVAQQDAERQKFEVLKDEEEKKANIIRAEGEAEGAKLISEAMRQYGDTIIEIRRIETAKYIAENLAQAKNVTYIPGNTVNLLNIST
eukprot:TRINITY_DN1212_c0_g1_i4.p1 TRINITY_DN1212_c0_g1~~TRINITY_DN1212_c0_g1_i4.p1  ORF type:complete len:274 (-),score=47.24 TRINITY_DN1212_c0_g1_i4:85-906(-)